MTAMLTFSCITLVNFACFSLSVNLSHGPGQAGQQKADLVAVVLPGQVAGTASGSIALPEMGQRMLTTAFLPCFIRPLSTDSTRAFALLSSASALSLSPD